MKTLLALLVTVLAAKAAIPPISTFDSEVRDWRVRVIAETNSVSDASYVKATEFMLYLKYTCIRTNIAWCGVFLGTSLTALSAPLIGDALSDPVPKRDVLNNFVSGDYSEATGLTGNGSTKYLYPGGPNGPSMSSWSTITNMHFAAYPRTVTGGNSGFLVACGDSVLGPAFLLVSHTDGNSWIYYGYPSSASVADAVGVGFYLISRNSLTNAHLFRNGTLLKTDTGAVTTRPNYGPAVLARRQDGSIDLYSNRQISFYSFGRAFTTNQVNAYYAGVQRLQRRMSRAITP